MLDKAIESGKEHRKSYHGAKAISKSCRNHGSCDYCLSNRQYHTNKEIEKTEQEIKDYLYNN